MKRKRKDTFQVVSDRNSVWFTRAIVVSCGAILLLRLISSYLPKGRLWGVNHLAYFSPHFVVGITILGLLVLIPRINHWLQNGLKKLLNFIYELTIRRHKYLYFVIFSFSSIVVFWFLRVKTHFLGDGYYLIDCLRSGGFVATWEPLEIAIHIFLYKFTSLFTVVDGATIYAFVSYLAGAIFVFFVILTADLLGKDKFEKTFVFCILVSMGSILLFLGYAEHYSLTYVTTLAYFCFSLKYLMKEGNILPVILTFGLACFLHLVSFLLFPSLLFLCLLRSDVETGKLHISKKRVFFCLTSILLAAIVIYVYVATLSDARFLSAILVPLSPTRYSMPYYTLFSFSHLLDMFNEHLLVSPIGLILLLSIVIISGLNEIGFKERIFQFFVIVTIFQLTFHFLVDPKIGAVRDWDLFSFTALGYTFLGLYLFLKLVLDKQRIRYLGTVLVCTSLFSTLPWVVLNADTKKPLKRIVNTVELDPARNFGFYAYVKEYIKKIGRLGAEEDKRMDELFMATFPLAWFYNKGEEQVRVGNYDAAETTFKEAVRIAPWRVSAHYNLGIFYKGRGKLDMSILEFEKAIQVSPEDVVAFDSYAELGKIYTVKRQFDKAIEMYKKAVEGKIDEKSSIYQNLGHCYLLKNNVDAAILAYEEALKFNPGLMEIHVYLGHAYLKKGMKGKAIEEYRVYLEYATNGKEVEIIKTLVGDLTRKS